MSNNNDAIDYIYTENVMFAREQKHVQATEDFMSFYQMMNRQFDNAESLPNTLGSLIGLACDYQYHGMSRASEVAIKKAEPIFFDLLHQSETVDTRLAVIITINYAWLGLFEDAIRFATRVISIMDAKYTDAQLSDQLRVDNIALLEKELLEPVLARRAKLQESLLFVDGIQIPRGSNIGSEALRHSLQAFCDIGEAICERG